MAEALGRWASPVRLDPAWWPGSPAGFGGVRRRGGAQPRACAGMAIHAHRSAEAPPRAGESRPGPPDSSLRLRLWPGQCSAGLDSAWRLQRRPQSGGRHGPLESHPARDQLPQRCRSGMGPEPESEDQAVTSGWVQPTAGQRSGFAVLGIALGVGSWSRRNPRPMPRQGTMPPGTDGLYVCVG